jgi:hypothetical protein
VPLPPTTQALHDYIARPSKTALANLRREIEPVLVARLTVLTSDRHAIREAIDEAFTRFAAAPVTRRSVNWLAWIVGMALAVLAERLPPCSWLDMVCDTATWVDDRDRRPLVFGAILTLDGRCQWALLARVGDGRWDASSLECWGRLQALLSQLGQ